MLLDLVIIFAIGGISWQLMRVLSKATETMDEFKTTNIKINKLVDKISYDYEYISTLVRGISSTIDRINQEIMEPIRGIGNVFQMVQNFLTGIIRKVSPERNEDEDYLPEGE